MIDFNYDDEAALLDQYQYGSMAEGELAELGPPSGPSPEPDRLRHEAVLNLMAYQGRTAQEELLRRDEAGELDPIYGNQVARLRVRKREEEDQSIVQRLASGELIISNQEDMQRLANNANARARFRASADLSDAQKEDLIAQTYADDARIRRAATPVPPELVPMSPDARIGKQLAQMRPEDQEELAGKLTVDSKGDIQVIRGLTPGKEEEPPPPVQDAQGVPGGGSAGTVAGLVAPAMLGAGPEQRAGGQEFYSGWERPTGQQLQNVARPKSYKEQTALKPGTWYVTPKNRMYRVPITAEQRARERMERETVVVPGEGRYQPERDKQGRIIGYKQIFKEAPAKEAAENEKASPYMRSIIDLRKFVTKEMASFSKPEEVQKWSLMKGTYTELVERTPEEIAAHQKQVEESVGLPDLIARDRRWNERQQSQSQPGPGGRGSTAPPAAGPGSSLQPGAGAPAAQPKILLRSKGGKWGWDGQRWVPLEE